MLIRSFCRNRILCGVTVALFTFAWPTVSTPAVARDDADLLIARTPPHTAQEEQRMFHLPPGFRIELVASEPDIVKPINMKFDSAGRLYVTQSYEYPFPHPEGRAAATRFGGSSTPTATAFPTRFRSLPTDCRSPSA